MDVCEFSPSYVRAIAPYQPGKPISEVAREFGLDQAKIIKLASNENPMGISPLAREAIEKEIAELSRYPDGNAFDLKGALSRKLGVDADAIVVGNGSNDLLEMLAGAFLAPGCAAVFSQHAFAIYPLATQARGALGIAVAAKNFAHDLDGMFAAITPDTRLVFIANPNNPTGTFASGCDIEQFLRRAPKEVVVVLDEAYNQYVPGDLRYDSIGMLEAHRNLVVLRTFSKIYGLAGLRVGFGVMDRGIADLLNRVRQPFNVNSLALAAACAALQDDAFVQRSFENNLAGMRQLEQGFRGLGLEFIPSGANFISFGIPRNAGRSMGGAVFDRLLRAGVIVRPLAGYEMPDHLRVTIGTPEENQAFLGALMSALKG
ncbi:MAG: histidinol-phosphate transaminase [Betaproteobacteria bacterium]|nr:histidinol-phosphate transaminase [Betaproteobacteria bacterium]